MPLMDSLVDWTWLKKRISELEDMKIATSKIKAKRKKAGEKNRTKYSEIVGQLQIV